jgi:hypothetical protein
VLVARLKPDNPRGAARITYDHRGTVFVLEGVGEITCAKLLDLENRQQLVWLVDQPTREQVRAAAMLRARRDAAERTAPRAPATGARRSVPRGTQPRASAPPPAPPPGAELASAGTAGERGPSRVVSPRPRPTGRPAGRRRLGAWAFAAIACVAVVSAGVLARNEAAGYLATTPAVRETRYSELYFTDPAALPTQLSADKADPLRFTVFNHEGRRQVYSYVVRLAGPNGSSVVDRGSIDLDASSSAARLVLLGPTRRPGTYSITVTVAEPSLTISFTGTS